VPAAPSTVTISSSAVTVMSLGAVAATLATLSHETLGHGLSCLSGGGQITLLTSIWFRCSTASGITDAGGPIGNLLAGWVAVALLRYVRPSPKLKLLLLMTGALNLFWFAGQLAFESLAHSHEDWNSAALYWAWPAIWRPVGAVTGIGGYVLIRRALAAVIHRQKGPRAADIRLAYAAAATFALIAGLMWRPEPLRSALEGLLCLGVAPFGLLSIARTASRDAAPGCGTSTVAHSWIWTCVCALAVGAFLVVQATGLGSMPEHHSTTRQSR
jgi:hypothetical protein